MALLFALIAETTLIAPGDLHLMSKALEQNAQHCAKDWDREAPAIVVCESRIGLPNFCQPIVFVDENTDPGLLAVHYWDPIKLAPAARVHVDRSSGMVSGRWSVSEAAAHEIVEALVDPRCDLWTDCPGRAGVDIALEVGDPVQDAYLIDGVAVTNYVTPAYFDTRFGDPAAAASFLVQGGKFDRLRTLSRAGAIGPEGYAVFRDATHRWTETAEGNYAALKPGASHFMARTVRRQQPTAYVPQTEA